MQVTNLKKAVKKRFFLKLFVTDHYKTQNKKAMKQDMKDEQIEISFLGFKFKCSNPTSKALIILMMLLIFFVVLVRLLPNLSLIRWFSG